MKYVDLFHRLVAHTTLPLDQLESLACWEHDGQLSRPVYGYPKITVRRNGKHRKLFAHALMYELVHGAVPEGHEIDHTCHNHRCINPEHLEALPVPQNRAKNQWRTRRDER